MNTILYDLMLCVKLSSFDIHTRKQIFKQELYGTYNISGITKRMPTDLLVSPKGFCCARQGFKMFIRSFKVQSIS
jgi:hypothetical protein